MYNKQVEIDQLISETMDALLASGIAKQTAWSAGYYGGFRSVRMYYSQRKQTVYNQETMDDYTSLLVGRYEKGELCRGYFLCLKKAVERLQEYYETGCLSWKYKSKVSKFKLNEQHETLLKDYMAAQQLHPNTRGDVIWAIRKYLNFVESEGSSSIFDTDTNMLRNFFIFCAQNLSASSLHNLKLYLRWFYKYLHDRSLLAIPYEGILSFPVVRERKILPCLPHEEINLVLHQIDLTTGKGKRDMAMILLGLYTGLRAVDIVNLKLTDIDWKRGEVSITQSKTGKPVTLPLMAGTGKSIMDYILKGRPKSDSDYVFLRAYAPYVKLTDGVAIGEMFDYYQKKAGITRIPWDGKGFHALRRTIGKDMTVSGVPVTTVSQVLGHSNMNSAKQYISLDSTNLKECALGFQGIEIGGEIYG